MKKAEVDARMADYLDGSLSIEDRALFDAHLDSDPDASREVEELQQTVALLRGLPDPEPPPQLAADVMRRIRLGESRPSLAARLGELLAELLTPRIAVPAAAVAAAVGVAVVTGNLPFPPGPADTPAASPAESTPMAAAREQRAPAPSTPEAREPASESAAAPGGRLAADVQPGTPPGRAGAVGSDPSKLAGSPAPVPVVTVPAAAPRTASRARGAVTKSAGAGASPSLAQQPGAQTPSLSASQREALQRQKLAAADQRLKKLIQDPEGFARQLALTSPGEQEAWVSAIAQHAVEHDLEDSAIEALRQSGDLVAASLADQLEVAVERVRPPVVAAETEGEGE